MIIYWKRMIVAIVLANALSLSVLHLAGALPGVITGIVGGLILGSLSQVPFGRLR